MTNGEVKESCSLFVDVVKKLKRNTLMWLDHVERMENESLTKMAYVNGMDGHYGRGRTRLKWRDGMMYKREWDGRG